MTKPLPLDCNTMTRKEKAKIVASLTERFNSTECFYIINAEGLSVEEVNDFRKRCFQAGVVYQVVKNTLIAKALKNLKDEVDYADFSSEILKGFSGILFTDNKGSVPAKLIQDFKKDGGSEHLTLKGASVYQELFIGAEHLDALSNLKSKTELIGDLIGLLQSPVARVMASLQSGKHQLTGVVEALKEKKS